MKIERRTLIRDVLAGSLGGVAIVRSETVEVYITWPGGQAPLDSRQHGDWRVLPPPEAGRSIPLLEFPLAT